MINANMPTKVRTKIIFWQQGKRQFDRERLMYAHLIDLTQTNKKWSCYSYV